MATIVEWDKLLNVVEAALIAGVGVVILFSLVIYGAAKASDAGRQERRALAGTYAVVAVLALLASGAAVVYGFNVMIKGSPKPAAKK